MRRLIMAIVCLMTMIIITSCGSDYKPSNMATELTPIFTEYYNWANNDLAVEPFKKEMITFFNNATGKEFASFYNGEVSFDEIIPTPAGHTNSTDSVAVRFKCSDLIFIKNVKGGDDAFGVHFDVISVMHKSEAAKLGGGVKYHLNGNIFGFLEDIDLDTFGIPTINMGYILCENLTIA